MKAAVTHRRGTPLHAELLGEERHAEAGEAGRTAGDADQNVGLSGDPQLGVGVDVSTAATSNR